LFSISSFPPFVKKYSKEKWLKRSGFFAAAFLLKKGKTGTYFPPAFQEPGSRNSLLRFFIFFLFFCKKGNVKRHILNEFYKIWRNIYEKSSKKNGV
jgi:hypothetical protein